MKIPMFIRVCAFLTIGAGVVFAAKAEVKWTYASNVLTGIAADGETAMQLNLTDDGILSMKVAGTQKVIDLSSDAMPEGTPAIRVISNRTFYQNGNITYVKLPEGLEVIGESAFHDCSALELVEPCIPGSVTNLGKYVFRSCSAMTNGVEIGFGEKDGEPLWVDMPRDGTDRNFAFRSCNKIPYLKYGPGVKVAPIFFYELSGVESLERVEFGENLEKYYDQLLECKKLTTAIFWQTKTFTFLDYQAAWPDNGYHTFPSSMREITWHGWFEYTANSGNPFSNVGNLAMRFIVPGNNLKWAMFMADSTKMTPWDKCADADKIAYTNRYGEAARTPAGIAVAVSGGLPRTYIVTDGTTYDGNTIQVADFESAFGKVTFDPEPDENGNFAAGDVTVTFEGAEGVTFTGWEGDAAEADKTKTTITIAASGIKNLTPRFTSTFLVYNKEAKELTDGQWTMVAEGEKDAITVKGLKRSLDSSFLMDFQRPIYGGGKITKMTSGVGIATGYKFPLTLESISGFTYDAQDKVKTYEPFLPDSVTNVGGSAFHWCKNIHGNIRIGFATNAAGESVETKLGTTLFTWMNYIGPKVELGPGIRKIPETFCNGYDGLGMSYDGPFDLWIGPNVEEACPKTMYGIRGTHTTSAQPLSVHFQGDMFNGSSGMFLASSDYKYWDNGRDNYVRRWDLTAAEPKAYSIRFYVGAEGCKKWWEFVSNAKYVTPWDKLDETVQNEYWAMFPKGDVYGKKHPYGLTTDAAVITNSYCVTNKYMESYGLPRSQWVFSLRSSGFVLRVQ